MADMVVETGTGLSNSNSYISLDDADLYHEKRLHVSDWTGSSGSVKEAALMWASGLLDKLVDWHGTKHTAAQSMRWPRFGTYDIDGYPINTNEIPQFLKDATAEYARLLIAEDVTAVNDLAGFKSVKIDVIKIEIDKWDRSGSIPKPVWDMIKNHGNKITARNKITERV